MKKILFLALMVITLASCSSDDDEKSSNEIRNELIGVWQESFYWDQTDWHTWGLVSPPVWVFNSDNTYQYYDSMSAYQSGNAASTGNWDISEKYLSTGNHARQYSFSDKQTLIWEKVAILKRYK